MPQKSIFRLDWGTLLLAPILAAAHGISDADKQRMLEGAIGSTLASAPRRLAHAHGLRPPAVPVRRRVLPDHIQGHRQVRHRVHTGPLHHADLRDLSADHLDLLLRRCLDRTTFGKPVPLPNLGELRGGPPSTSVGNFFVRRHRSLPALLASWAIGNLVKATTCSRAQDCLKWTWPVACRAAKDCDNKCPRTCNGCQKSPEIPTDLIPARQTLFPPNTARHKPAPVIRPSRTWQGCVACGFGRRCAP